MVVADSELDLHIRALQAARARAREVKAAPASEFQEVCADAIKEICGGSVPLDPRDVREADRSSGWSAGFVEYLGLSWKVSAHWGGRDQRYSNHHVYVSRRRWFKREWVPVSNLADLGDAL